MIRSHELYDHEAIVRVGEMLEAKGALPKTFMGIAPGSTDAMTWDDVLRIASPEQGPEPRPAGEARLPRARFPRPDAGRLQVDRDGRGR